MWVAIVGSRTLGEDCGCTGSVEGRQAHPEDCPKMVAWLLMLKTLARLLKRPGFEGIVTGGAKGADHLAEEAANLTGLKCRVHLPSAEKGRTFGERAHKRNQRVINNAESVIAFFDPRYAKSPGTIDAIQLARNAGKEVHVWWGKWEQ